MSRHTGKDPIRICRFSQVGRGVYVVILGHMGIQGVLPPDYQIMYQPHTTIILPDVELDEQV